MFHFVAKEHRAEKFPGLHLGGGFVPTRNGGGIILPHNQTRVCKGIQGAPPKIAYHLLVRIADTDPAKGERSWKIIVFECDPHPVGVLGTEGKRHNHNRYGVGDAGEAESNLIGGASEC